MREKALDDIVEKFPRYDYLIFDNLRQAYAKWKSLLPSLEALDLVEPKNLILKGPHDWGPEPKKITYGNTEQLCETADEGTLYVLANPCKVLAADIVGQIGELDYTFKVFSASRSKEEAEKLYDHSYIKRLRECWEPKETEKQSFLKSLISKKPTKNRIPRDEEDIVSRITPVGYFEYDTKIMTVLQHAITINNKSYGSPTSNTFPSMAIVEANVGPEGKHRIFDYKSSTDILIFLMSLKRLH